MGGETEPKQFDADLWVKHIQHRWIDYEGSRSINFVGDLGTIFRDFLRQEFREFKTNYEKYEPDYNHNTILTYFNQLEQFMMGRIDKEYGNLQSRKEIEKIQAEIDKIKIDSIPQLTFWKVLSTFGLALFAAMTSALTLVFDSIIENPWRALPIAIGYIAGFALLLWGVRVLYLNDQKKLNTHEELFK